MRLVSLLGLIATAAVGFETNEQKAVSFFKVY